MREREAAGEGERQTEMFAFPVETSAKGLCAHAQYLLLSVMLAGAEVQMIKVGSGFQRKQTLL